MKRSCLSVWAGLACLFFSSLAFANAVAISGTFTSDDDVIAALPGACQGAGNLPVNVVADLQVSQSGDYLVADLAQYMNGDIVIHFYQGAFNANNPNANLVESFDTGGSVSLTMGQTYSMVVQSFCNAFFLPWSVGLSGAGDITASNAAELQSWQVGNFNNQDSNTFIPYCDENLLYEIQGPVRVPEDGIYHFADMSINYSDGFLSDDGTSAGVDLLVAIADAQPTPQNIDANVITIFDDFGFLRMEAGQDYWFVITGLCTNDIGEWAFTLAPPGPLRINNGLNDAWYNPNTVGQGFFVNVFPTIDFMFLGWFTFEDDQAAAMMQAGGGNMKAVGDGSQRWLTANGSWESNVATLDVVSTSGGIFDDPVPATNTAPDSYGTITIEFDGNCTTATLDYDLFGASPPTQGTMPLNRIVPDQENVDSCQFPGAIAGEIIEF